MAIALFKMFRLHAVTNAIENTVTVGTVAGYNHRSASSTVEEQSVTTDGVAVGK